MKLKMALATLGLSILGATSALAQVSFPGLTVAIDTQQLNTPGILDYNASFVYDPTAIGASPNIFVVPNGIANISPLAGYTLPEDTPGLDLGIYPLQLGTGNGIFGADELTFSLRFDNTAQNALGSYSFNVYTGDPFDPATPDPTLVSAPFAANVRPTNVPEPGTVALLVGMGIAGVTLRRRRK